MFRAFLDLAGKIRLDGAAVKWQFVGPVTLGVALHRAGLDREPAFDLALSTSFEIVSLRSAASSPTRCRTRRRWSCSTSRGSPS